MARNQGSPRSVADVERARQLNFSANIPANDGEDITREVPFDGKVVELFYGAASATQNLVGVSVKYSGTGEQVFPGDRETDYINLAAVNHPFTLTFPVEETEEITVRYENQDDEPHYMNIILTVVTEEEA